MKSECSEIVATFRQNPLNPVDNPAGLIKGYGLLLLVVQRWRQDEDNFIN